MSRSQLEKCSPFIVESKLRNCKIFSSEINNFFKNCCPRFKDFNSSRILNEKSGAGMDSQIIIIYKELEEILELHILMILNDINVSEAAFIQAIQESSENDESISSLMNQIFAENSNILDFCAFMEEKYNELYKNNEVKNNTAITGNNEKIENIKLDKIEISTECKQVRVLWDIENISISKQIGGLNTVSKLQSFLATLDLYGKGIDMRITAFFNPRNSSTMSAGVVNELDHAGVEMIWVL
jgi:hypothetical protein